MESHLEAHLFQIAFNITSQTVPQLFLDFLTRLLYGLHAFTCLVPDKGPLNGCKRVLLAY